MVLTVILHINQQQENDILNLENWLQRNVTFFDRLEKNFIHLTCKMKGKNINTKQKARMLCADHYVQYIVAILAQYFCKRPRSRLKKIDPVFRDHLKGNFWNSILAYMRFRD